MCLKLSEVSVVVFMLWFEVVRFSGECSYMRFFVFGVMRGLI